MILFLYVYQDPIVTIKGKPTYDYLLINNNPENNSDNSSKRGTMKISAIDKKGNIKWECTNCGPAIAIMTDTIYASEDLSKQIVYLADIKDNSIVSQITNTDANPHEIRKGFTESEVIALSYDGETFSVAGETVTSGSIKILDMQTKKSSAIDLGKHFDPSKD